MDTKDMDKILTEDILDERTIVSFHKRPIETMVAAHKEHLQSKNHKIIQHKTYKDGSHEILHQTPLKKFRLTTITQAQKRGVVTKVTNKPTNNDR
jgi:hypothetical protein